MSSGRVAFSTPRERVFDYLVDPANRPEWQSSLRRVSRVVGQPGVGQSWVDETKAGVNPAMRTTAYERPRLWSEAGSWRFVRAELTLRFEPEPAGCAVDYRFRIEALGPLGRAASWLARPAVGADLRRAARILGS